MFKMPEGKEIDVEIVVQKGAIQPFDVGVISTYFGRRKTPLLIELSGQVA